MFCKFGQQAIKKLHKKKNSDPRDVANRRALNAAVKHQMWYTKRWYAGKPCPRDDILAIEDCRVSLEYTPDTVTQ